MITELNSRSAVPGLRWLRWFGVSEAQEQLLRVAHGGAQLQVIEKR